MSPIIQGVFIIILGTISVAILSFPFKFIFKRPRPKINFIFTIKHPHLGPLIDGVSKCRWILVLEFYNNSQHDASELEIFKMSQGCPFENSKLMDSHLTSFKRISLEARVFKFCNELERRELPKKLTSYIPDEFSKFSLLVKYKNLKGQAFYSRFVKCKNHEKSTVHFFKPKLKKCI